VKVCVDIQSAIAQRAGVGRYTKLLVEHLADQAGDDELALFYFDFMRRGVPFPVGDAVQKAVHWIPGRFIQTSWKKFHWPPFDRFAGSADVYHFPNFIRPPLSYGKSVVTIHDVAFLRYPETIESGNLKYLHANIRKTVRDTDVIIAVSEFTASEICELLDAPCEKIEVIHQGLAPNMIPPGKGAVSAMRQELDLQKPYLLIVSTLEPRKNIPFLVDVYEALGDFDGDLVIAGMRGWKYEPILKWIQNSPRSAQIKQIDFVSEEHLPALYAGAELFVFPSLYEGFGFPPLEAMACGTPVISSMAGSLPEILGDAVCLMDGYDTQKWADKIHNLLHDNELRKDLIQKGLQQTQLFTWEATARKTWNLYRELGH